jgi:hypothetical protein
MSVDHISGQVPGCNTKREFISFVKLPCHSGDASSTATGGNSELHLRIVIAYSLGTRIMNYNRRIFETIIDALRRSNVGLSINDLKDIVPTVPKEEKFDKPPEKKPEKKA